jgi:hypothetical protein
MSYTLGEYKTMNSIVNEINESFTRGIVPSFFLSNDENDNVDWSKIKYNTFYKSPEYFIDKLPKGFHNLPGADKIIEQVILNAKTPLEEILERRMGQGHAVLCIPPLSEEYIENPLEENLSNISINE